MISKHNLLALRNAIDDVLADLKAEPARKRLTKEEKLIERFEKMYGAGPFNAPKKQKQ